MLASIETSILNLDEVHYPFRSIIVITLGET